MRSTRGILGLPPLKLALSLILAIAALGAATPGLLTQTVSSPGIAATTPARSDPAVAIEGWITSVANGATIAGASVSLEGGVTVAADGNGYFSFPAEQLAAYTHTQDSPYLPVSLHVKAEGFASWTIRSARYYKGDTLRVYPKLDSGNSSPKVNIAAQPRRDLNASVNTGDYNNSTASLVATTGFPNSTAFSLQAQTSGAWTPPATIRVYRTATGVVEVVPFKEYVKHVLPHEWIPTWPVASLRAGALAVKEYAWYWVYNGGKQTRLGADVKDNTEDQVYDPNLSYASTDAAVEATWEYALLRDGTLFQAQYCAGSYQADPSGDCPWGGPYMTQWGSTYHAEQGQSWEWIVQFYYNCTITSVDTTLNPPSSTYIPPAPPEDPVFAVGQGASVPDIFIEAYERNGGQARLGKPLSEVGWWLPYVTENNVQAQSFSGADGNGSTWLIYDILKAEVSGFHRAYLVDGLIGQAYAQNIPSGPEWVGAPTTDPYISAVEAGQVPTQGFARGRLSWDGLSAVFTPWPSTYAGWQAKYFAGLANGASKVPELDITGQPALVIDQPEPNLDWYADLNVPATLGLGNGGWSAQFSKDFQLDAGTYDIVVTADSGVRVWVDNLLAINAWNAGGTHTEQYNLDMDGAGHTIRIQYHSPNSGARLAFNISKRVVPVEPQNTAPQGGDVPPSALAKGAEGHAGLRVQVRWLGRPDPPSDHWVQPLALLLSRPGDPTIIGTYMGSTDQNGVAIYSNLPAGIYDVHVKGLHSLQSARANIELIGNQTVDVDMKTQVEGDLNGDNCVTVSDFTIVQTMVGSHKDIPGWNASADLNNDGQVTVTDISLLRSGFDMCGDISADNQLHMLSVEGAPTFEQQLGPWLDTESLQRNLGLGMSASSDVPTIGSVIEVQVYADAGTQAIDGGSFLLRYDPLVLQPVDARGNPTASSEPGIALPAVLGNWIDTQGGAVGYAASMVQGTAPQGIVPLATLRFRALQSGATELHFAPLSMGQMQVTNGGTNLLGRTGSLNLIVTP